MPFNFDSSDLKSLFSTKLVIHSRKKARKSARKIKAIGINADRYLICSDWDFHKTRLNDFNRSDIYTYDEFNSLCLSKGLTLKKLREFNLNPAATSKLPGNSGFGASLKGN
jgi:hypothetical protein